MSSPSSPVLFASAYASAGLLCLLAARVGAPAQARVTFWSLACVLLLLLAAAVLLALDVLFVEVVRGVAREQGWYGQRRLWQLGVLGGLGLVSVVGLAKVRKRLVLLGTAGRWGLIGLLLLAATNVLRFVSHHDTDGLLHARLAAVSVGRLIEALGLGMTACGALRSLRDR